MEFERDDGDRLRRGRLEAKDPLATDGDEDLARQCLRLGLPDAPALEVLRDESDQ